MYKLVRITKDSYTKETIESIANFSFISEILDIFCADFVARSIPGCVKTHEQENYYDTYTSPTMIIGYQTWLGIGEKYTVQWGLQKL